MSDKKKRVLFVDDDTTLLRAELRQVKASYPEVFDLIEKCDNGKTALELVQQDPEAEWFIRTDYQMRGGDGHELIRAIRAMTPPVRAFLILTTSSTLESETALAFGADAFLYKGEGYYSDIIDHLRVFMGA